MVEYTMPFTVLRSISSSTLAAKYQEGG